MTVTWLLANARIPGREARVDLLLLDGRLQLLAPGTARSSDWRLWDLQGRVVLPGLIELHAHLDKTYTDCRNPEGTLLGAIRRFEAVAAERTLMDLETRAERALRVAIAHGVTRLRTHLMLGEARDLAALEVMTGLRRRFADAIELQFVAMTSDLGDPVRAHRLEAAVALGIDLIGGAPSLSSDPHASVTELVSAARRFELGIDLHIDEDDSRRSVGLRSLVEQRDLPTGPGAVTASHCCSLAFMAPLARDALLSSVAERDIALVVLPACNLVLQGRGHWPVPRGSAPIQAARTAGVCVAAGVDNVQDPFNPFGDYDPLQSARLAAMVGHLATDGDFSGVLDLVTANAATIFGGAPARIAAGLPADLVVTDTLDPERVIAAPPARLATFKGGRLVVRTSIEQDWLALNYR